MIVSLIVGGAVALGLWAFFAPTKLGGSTTYSVTSGISMQPLLHKNDLALVRTQSSYHVGEIVLYQSSVVNRPVLHRIILIQNGRYFFKGDNNNFVDPGYATRGALVGALWFSVPSVGSVLSWFGQPVHAAVVAGAAVLMIALTGVATTRRRRRRRRGSAKMQPGEPALTVINPRTRDEPAAGTPSQRAAGRRRPRAYLKGPTATLVSIGVTMALALLMLGVGFTRPLHQVAPLPNAYQHTGTFSYSATANAPNAVYPSGLVTTGDPIYPSLVDSVTLRFGYRFVSTLPHQVKGTIELRALVLSQTDTWQRLSTVAPTITFSGDSTVIQSALSLSGLYTLIDSVAKQAGVPGASYSADIQPVVHITGHVGHRPINDSFSPVLPVSVTQSVIRIDVAAAPAPPGATFTPTSAKAQLATALHPAQPGSVPHVVSNEIAVAKYQIAVSSLRTFGIILAILSLMLAVLHDRLRRRQSRQSDEERIASRFHSLIVPVRSLARPEGPPPIAVPNFTQLAGLARYLERPILYEARDGNRTFAVDDEDRRYVTSADDRRSGRGPGDAVQNEPAIHWRPPSDAAPPRHRGRGSLIVRAGAVVLVLAVAATVTISLTASNTVPPSNVGRSVATRQIPQLTPAGCSSLTLNSLRIVSGTVVISTSNTLVLGSANADDITDNASNNCIVGGGGQDNVKADSSDVCIIGPTSGAKYKKCTTHS